MKQRKTKILIMLMFSCSLMGLNAQQTFTNTGGDAIGGEGSITYTIGQLMYTTVEGNNGSVANGVQQPYEISVIGGIEETQGIKLVCSAFPNPTTEYLTLKIEYYNFEDISYSLFSLIGSLLEREKINNKETYISMFKYQRGNYILRVVNNNIEVKSFSIMKN